MEVTMESFIKPLSLTEQSKADHLETAKWAKFLAIMGFISAGFLIIFAFFMGTLFNTVLAQSNSPLSSSGMMGSGLITGIYLVIGFMMIIPSYYEYKFATQTKRAILDDDQNAFDEGIKNHKSFYKFKGILTIIGLAIYGIFILLAIIGGGMGLFFGK